MVRPFLGPAALKTFPLRGACFGDSPETGETRGKAVNDALRLIKDCPGSGDKKNRKFRTAAKVFPSQIPHPFVFYDNKFLFWSPAPGLGVKRQIKAPNIHANGTLR